MRESMDLKNKARIIAGNMALFVLLYVLTSFNKTLLRPNFHDVFIVDILIGSVPNFLAAFFLTLCFVNPVLTVRPSLGKVIVYGGAIIIFVILAFEEIVPMWGASVCYDIYDIIGSAIGSASAVLIYEILKKKAVSRHEE